MSAVSSPVVRHGVAASTICRRSLTAAAFGPDAVARVQGTISRPQPITAEAMTEPAAISRYFIRPMTIADYDSVIDLMKQTDGVSFRDADSRDSTERYLLRNPDLSFVALASNALVGCIMSGHDGRRGYLQHLVVLPAHRHQGMASGLVENCLAELERLGILKSHVDVLQTNTPGHNFWESRNWKFRTDIRRYSLIRSGGDNV